MSSNRCVICSGELSNLKTGYFDTRFGIARFYSIGECLACGLKQTVPLPEADELKNLYQQFYNFGGENSSKYWKYRDLFLSSILYRICLSFDGDISFHLIKGKGELLDIGCNEGRGLVFYQRNGFHSFGYELNEKAARKAKDLGFDVFTSRLDEIGSANSFDVCVLSNVLEHSLNPDGLLKEIRRLLKEKGEVWISCPNDRSWANRLFGKFWINWHVPFHITHFSEDSLKSVLLKNDFKIIRIRQETPALWVGHSILALAFSRPGQINRQLRNPWLILILILVIRGIFFPILWLGNLLGKGDCLIFIAQKE